MNKPIEIYGQVQILQANPFQYFYNINLAAIGNKRGNELINILLNDDNIEEIMYIGERKSIKIYHSKYGMCNTNITLSEHDALSFISDSAIGDKKMINFKDPLLDATLKDGSRLNATIPPASVDGSTFTIRKFKKNFISVLDLIKSKTITSEIGAFLWTCIEGLNIKPANIIFSGGTASGKTTNLNAFAMFIPNEARIVTIEDTVELNLIHEHLIRLNSLPESKIEMKDLLLNTLRMRPDRIIVGEVRGNEAINLFSAMNTGHNGCFGTIHARSTKEALTRITQEPMNVPISMLSALDLIIHQQRIISGREHNRYITEISEVIPSSNSLPKINVLFKWNPSKKICYRTGIPSRLRDSISNEAGIPPKKFIELLQYREKLLEQANIQNFGIGEFTRVIFQNRYKN